MAISVRVTEASILGRMRGELAPVLVLPPIKSKNYAAAGLTDAFDENTKVIRLRCIGDAVYFRVNQVDTNDTTQAAIADSKSNYLAVGEIFDFVLPPGTSAANYKIDIRAA